MQSIMRRQCKEHGADVTWRNEIRLAIVCWCVCACLSVRLSARPGDGVICVGKGRECEGRDGEGEKDEMRDQVKTATACDREAAACVWRIQLLHLPDPRRRRRRPGQAWNAREQERTRLCGGKSSILVSLCFSAREQQQQQLTKPPLLAVPACVWEEGGREGKGGRDAGHLYPVCVPVPPSVPQFQLDFRCREGKVAACFFACLSRDSDSDCIAGVVVVRVKMEQRSSRDRSWCKARRC